MDFKKILRAFLTNVYKMSDGEIDALLLASENNTDDTAIAAILARDQARVTELQKPKAGMTFQDGYKKAKAEVLTQLETELKERYNVTSDATGIDLIAEVITAKEQGPKLTDDQVRAHPLFLQYEKDMKKALKEKETEMTNKITELENTYKKNEVFGEVSGEVMKVLEPLKPVFPGTPAVASTLKNKFLEEFKGYDYQKGADGKFAVLKDGKAQTDPHGNTLYLDDLVKTVATNYFEFQQNNGGGNAGNGGQGDQGNNGGQPAGYPAGIKKPTTFEELNTITSNMSIPASDRMTVLKTWEAEQAGQKA